MTQWFWSGDHHFDHANIIKHTHRPFADVQQMNDALISNWNNTVRGRDVVVYVGDLTMHHDLELVRYLFMRFLNGNIIWIKGNHDGWYRTEKRHIYHKKVNDQFVVSSHYPLRSWNQSQHGSWNLHGHSHGEIEPFYNQLDVGVDAAFKLVGEYRPLEFSEIKEFIIINNAAMPDERHKHYHDTRTMEPEEAARRASAIHLI